MHHNPVVGILDCTVVNAMKPKGIVGKVQSFLAVEKEKKLYLIGTSCSMRISLQASITSLLLLLTTHTLSLSIRAIPGHSSHTTVHFLHLLGHENFISLYPLLAGGCIRVEDPRDAGYCNCDCLEHRQMDNWMDRCIAILDV